MSGGGALRTGLGSEEVMELWTEEKWRLARVRL